MSIEYNADFDTYSNETKVFVRWLDATVNNVADAKQYPEFIISIIGIFLNIFHLIILTRKSMRSTSINVLMIGIAISDLFVMIYGTYLAVIQLMNSDLECLAPSSYTRVFIEFFAFAMRDSFRRVSAWLGVLMAAIRFLIIKNPLNPRIDFLSRPSFSWKIVLLLFVSSSLLSSSYWTQVRILPLMNWEPAEHCTGFPANFTAVQYAVMTVFVPTAVSDTFTSFLFYKTFWFTEGILKIIPAILLPILAFLLIRELKKAAKARRKLTSSQNSETPQKDHTTNLVILMTVSFVITELPLGVFHVADTWLEAYSQNTLATIITNMTFLWTFFVALNATTHCFICMTMSSQYRNCVKTIFCKNGKLKPVIVSSKASVSSVTSVRNVIVEI